MRVFPLVRRALPLVALCFALTSLTPAVALAHGRGHGGGHWGGGGHSHYGGGRYGGHWGGRSYGYTSAIAEDGRGRRMVIDDKEAAVVRWVFEQFADGHSTRHIAHQLNARGTPSARGGTWAVSALQGSSGKGLGMLNNELYAGRVVWNRRQWLKDPETGRRRYVERPQSEWQTREAPELRIVSAELWQRVQDRARRGPARGTRTGKGAM